MQHENRRPLAGEPVRGGQREGRLVDWACVGQGVDVASEKRGEAGGSRRGEMDATSGERDRTMDMTGRQHGENGEIQGRAYRLPPPAVQRVASAIVDSAAKVSTNSSIGRHGAHRRQDHERSTVLKQIDNLHSSSSLQYRSFKRSRIPVSKALQEQRSSNTAALQILVKGNGMASSHGNGTKRQSKTDEEEQSLAVIAAKEQHTDVTTEQRSAQAIKEPHLVKATKELLTGKQQSSSAAAVQLVKAKVKRQEIVDMQRSKSSLATAQPIDHDTQVISRTITTVIDRVLHVDQSSHLTKDSPKYFSMEQNQSAPARQPVLPHAKSDPVHLDSRRVLRHAWSLWQKCQFRRALAAHAAQHLYQHQRYARHWCKWRAVLDHRQLEREAVQFYLGNNIHVLARALARWRHSLRAHRGSYLVAARHHHQHRQRQREREVVERHAWQHWYRLAIQLPRYRYIVHKRRQCRFFRRWRTWSRTLSTPSDLAQKALRYDQRRCLYAAWVPYRRQWQQNVRFARIAEEWFQARHGCVVVAVAWRAWRQAHQHQQERHDACLSFQARAGRKRMAQVLCLLRYPRRLYHMALALHQHQMLTEAFGVWMRRYKERESDRVGHRAVPLDMAIEGDGWPVWEALYGDRHYQRRFLLRWRHRYRHGVVQNNAIAEQFWAHGLQRHAWRILIKTSRLCLQQCIMHQRHMDRRRLWLKSMAMDLWRRVFQHRMMTAQQSIQAETMDRTRLLRKMLVYWRRQETLRQQQLQTNQSHHGHSIRRHFSVWRQRYRLRYQCRALERLAGQQANRRLISVMLKHWHRALEHRLASWRNDERANSHFRRLSLKHGFRRWTLRLEGKRNWCTMLQKANQHRHTRLLQRCVTSLGVYQCNRKARRALKEKAEAHDQRRTIQPALEIWSLYYRLRSCQRDEWMYADKLHGEAVQLNAFRYWRHACRGRIAYRRKQSQLAVTHDQTLKRLSWFRVWRKCYDIRSRRLQWLALQKERQKRRTLSTLFSQWTRAHQQRYWDKLAMIKADAQLEQRIIQSKFRKWYLFPYGLVQPQSSDAPSKTIPPWAIYQNHHAQALAFRQRQSFQKAWRMWRQRGQVQERLREAFAEALERCQGTTSSPRPSRNTSMDANAMKDLAHLLEVGQAVLRKCPSLPRLRPKAFATPLASLPTYSSKNLEWNDRERHLARKYTRRWMTRMNVSRASPPPFTLRRHTVSPRMETAPTSIAPSAATADPEILAMEAELAQYQRHASTYAAQKRELQQYNAEIDTLTPESDTRRRHLQRQTEHYEAFTVSRKAAIRTISMRIQLKLDMARNQTN